MDVEMIVSFFKNYGWQLSCLALTGMIILGFLKWIGCFKKLPSNCKKYVYYAISCGLSIIACSAYILLNHSFEWVSWLILCGAVILFSGAVYTVWENTGLRALFKKCVLDLITKLFSALKTALVNGSLTNDKVKEEALKLGTNTLAQLYQEAKKIEEQEKNKQEVIQ